MPVANRIIWKTGVYLITNTVNGKVYVGSSSQVRGVAKRLCNHKRLLRQNKHHNEHLQRAWDKYGESAFEFSVLLLCPPELCLGNEQVFINRLRATDPNYGYNIAPTAGSVLGMKLSEESRAKISENNKGRVMSAEGKASISAANKGRKHSTETRAKVSAAGRRRKHSSETKARMVESARIRELKRRQDRLERTDRSMMQPETAPIPERL